MRACVCVCGKTRKNINFVDGRPPLPPVVRHCVPIPGVPPCTVSASLCSRTRCAPLPPHTCPAAVPRSTARCPGWQFAAAVVSRIADCDSVVSVVLKNSRGAFFKVSLLSCACLGILGRSCLGWRLHFVTRWPAGPRTRRGASVTGGHRLVYVPRNRHAPYTHSHSTPRRTAAPVRTVLPHPHEALARRLSVIFAIQIHIHIPRHVTSTTRGSAVAAPVQSSSGVASCPSLSGRDPTTEAYTRSNPTRARFKWRKRPQRSRSSTLGPDLASSAGGEVNAGRKQGRGAG